MRMRFIVERGVLFYDMVVSNDDGHECTRVRIMVYLCLVSRVYCTVSFVSL